jgi:hypothetical protein
MKMKHNCFCYYLAYLRSNKRKSLVYLGEDVVICRLCLTSSLFAASSAVRYIESAEDGPGGERAAVPGGWRGFSQRGQPGTSQPL